MNHPTKTCPACGADLSAGTAAMPGVCPACGRDLKLEAIVANLPRTETKLKKPPLDWGECSLAAFGLCLILFIVAGFAFSNEGIIVAALVFVLGTPNLFLGFFAA